MNMTLFERISINLPEIFSEMQEEERSRYFGAASMDHAFVNRADHAVIGVVRTQTPLTDDAVERQICAYHQQYSRMVPGYVKGDLRQKTIAGHTVAIMSYGANAPDRNLYNLLAITALEEREVVFLFACDMNDALEYMGIFLGVLNSMSDL